jgi:predicted amidohydrolase YtcJ
VTGPLDPSPAEQVVIGDLITRDERRPRAAAMAIRGDRIVAVGSEADARAAVGAAAIVTRAPGAVVVPGFVDAHVHMLIAGVELRRLDLDGVTSIDDVLHRIATHAAADTAAEWIVAAANFQAEDLAEQRLPTRAELDAVTGDRPAFLDQRTHDGIANSAALRRAGIDRTTPDPAGGRIARDADGEPTGLLVERPAAELVHRLVPSLSPADRLRALREIQPRLHALGITTIQEPGLVAAELAAYAALRDTGELTMRTLAMPLVEGDVPIATTLERIGGLGVRTGFGDDRLRLGAVKVYYDGTGSFGTALLREPWPGTDDDHGTQVISDADFEQVARFCARERWSLAVHTVGGAAVDRVLAQFAAVDREWPIADLRFSVMHAYLWPSAQNLADAARLGVIASIQPGMQWRVGSSLVRRFGREAVRDTSPIRDWLDAGVVVAGGSDGPDFPMAPLRCMSHARTRLVNGLQEPLGPEQAITADEALTLYTTAAARGCFSEHDRGALRPGLLADWAALSVDPLAADAGAVHDARVLQTTVGGRAVHLQETR